MKKITLLIVALVVLGAFAFAEFKIGIINPQVVLQESAKGKDFGKRLQELQQSKQKRYEAMQKEIENLEKESMSPALNTEARDKKAQDLANKRTEIKRFAEDAQREIVAFQQKELEKIQSELIPIIAKTAKEDGFAMVLDPNTAGVAYYEPVYDISEKVAKAYDAASAAPAAPPAAKK